MKLPWQKPEAPLMARPEINTDDVIRLGELAERLLESEIFVHSIERARARLRVEWQETDDHERREELYRTSKCFRLIAMELNAIVAEGIAERTTRAGDRRLAAME